MNPTPRSYEIVNLGDIWMAAFDHLRPVVVLSRLDNDDLASVLFNDGSGAHQAMPEVAQNDAPTAPATAPSYFSRSPSATFSWAALE